MTEDLYLSLKASISNWIYSIGQQKAPEVKVFDFDATAEEEDIPQEDYLGPIEFYVSADGTLGEVGFKVAACTHEDPQIQRLNELINRVVNNCMGKNVTIPVLHYDTGTPIGILASDGGFMASPVVRLQSRTRPFQTVSLLFNLTLTF